MREARKGVRGGGEVGEGGSKRIFWVGREGRLHGGGDSWATLGGWEDLDIRKWKRQHPGRKEGINQGFKQRCPLELSVLMECSISALSDTIDSRHMVTEHLKCSQYD